VVQPKRVTILKHDDDDDDDSNNTFKRKLILTYFLWGHFVSRCHHWCIFLFLCCHISWTFLRYACSSVTL